MKCGVLLLLAGCDAAFGIQHVDPDAATDAVDARPAVEIAGTLAQDFLSNNSTYVPTLLKRIVPTANVAIFAIDDVTGLSTQIAYDATDGSFVIPAGTSDRTRVQLRFGTTIVEYQWNLPALHVELQAYGRLDEVLADPNTMLHGSYSGGVGAMLDPAVFATGIWQSAAFATDGLGAYTSAPLAVLESGIANDELVFVAYDYDAQLNVVLDQAQVVSKYEMQSGVNNLDIALAAISPDTCLHATTNLPGDVARIEAFSTGFDGVQTSANVIVYALPVPAIGGGIAWNLANTPGVPDDDVVISFNRTVFPHFTPVPATVVSRARMLPNGNQLGVEMLHYEELGGTDCTTTTTFPVATVAFPGDYVLANAVLASDTAAVHLTTPTAQLTWTANGVADLYLVQLYDATLNTYVPLDLFTTATHATIDATALTVGHAYVFVVSAYLGLPNVAQGDVTTHAYPFEVTLSASSMFTVQ